MGRKKAEPENVRGKRVASYLPTALYERVEKRAEKEKRTISTMLLILIEKGLSA